MSQQRTSQKHREFSSEPLGAKRVTALPGIGEAHGVKLAARGYDTASKVVGQHMVMDNNPQFKAWLNDTTGANTKVQSDCANGVTAWRENFSQ